MLITNPITWGFDPEKSDIYAFETPIGRIIWAGIKSTHITDLGFNACVEDMVERIKVQNPATLSELLNVAKQSRLDGYCLNTNDRRVRSPDLEWWGDLLQYIKGVKVMEHLHIYPPSKKAPLRNEEPVVSVRTDGLTHAALCWAVAKAKGIPARIRAGTHSKVPYIQGMPPLGPWQDFDPVNDWSVGGPIAEAAGISIQITIEAGPYNGKPSTTYVARSYNAATNGQFAISGTHELEARMRCFVLAKLGNYVDIPVELMPAA
jgi:hypothetical protein